jgi:hypothetical protein
MSSSLVIPPVINKKVQPKPTKAELVEALARRKIDQLQKEKADAHTEYKVIEEEFKAGVREYVEKNISALLNSGSVGISTGHYHSASQNQRAYWSSPGISFNLDNLPADLHKRRVLMGELHKKVWMHIPSLSEARRAIRCALDGVMPAADKHSRVAAMLADTGVTKALDKMLEHFDAAADKARLAA